jgi:hypothetical protein
MNAALTIVNARIVDVRSATVSREMDVTIEGERIVSIRKASRKVRSGEIFDARSQYLMPGLWDMHAHVNYPAYAAEWILPMMTASGVTGVRDLSGDCWQPGCPDNIGFMRQLQARVDSGELIGPRLLSIGSGLVHGPRRMDHGAPAWSAPQDADHARELVRQLKARGVDFIKPYDTLPRDAYLAMLKEARRLKLPVSGHVPMSIASTDAVRAGQSTIEHAKHPIIDCSRYGPEFHQIFAQWAAGASHRIYRNWATAADGDEDIGGYYEPILAGFDAALCSRVLRSIARSGAYYVPTLITRKFEALADHTPFLSDPRLQHVPPQMRADWNADAGRFQKRFASSPAEKAAYLGLYQRAVELVGKAHAAGIPILVGTDATDSYCFPGSSLHDELRELSAGGMPNAAILRAATLSAAEFLGRTRDFGTVERGKVADLILVAADPLDHIDNTRLITAVVRNGRLLDGEALRALQTRAEAFVAALPAP